ncbi:MAG: hypothetical protein ACOY90_15280 [Candidatus Zhuqueibacterota bacterium]
MTSFTEKRISTMILLFLMVVSQNSFAEIYFVAPDGNDQNPGAQALPWQTVGKANETVQPGDIVYLREGRYRETIQPGRSGAENQPIIFRGFESEIAVIHSRPQGVNLSGLDYIVIQGLYFEACDYFVRSYPGGCNHCIIRDNTMNQQTGWCGIEIGDRSSFNQVLRNRIHSEGIEGDCIHIGLDEVGETTGAWYNIVAGNECSGALHGGICCAGDKSRFNIIQENYIHDIGDNAIATGALTQWVLIEGNRIHNPGADADGACGIQLRSEHGIVRRNILTRNIDVTISNDAAALELQSTVDRPYVRSNKIYHNVFYNFSQGANSWYGVKLAVYNQAVQFGPNVFKNNIIFRNGAGPGGGYQIAYTRQVQTMPVDQFSGNLVSSGSVGADVVYFFEFSQLALSLQEAIQAYPPIFTESNFDANPQFRNESEYNFALTPESPCIDAGAFLTECVDSGVGYELHVEDAGYFTDGWGVMRGDEVNVGFNPPVAILHIDYENSRIAVNALISWQVGDPVSLKYSGRSPDMGAFEFDGTDHSAPETPTGVKVQSP